MADKSPEKFPGKPAPRDEQADEKGRFAYEGLDRLIHERARLAILSSLASHAGGLSFNDLKELCVLTDGNLSRQLSLLKESGLVDIEKGTSNNRPLTVCRLTPRGRKRFQDYIAVLEGVVADAAKLGPAAPFRNGKPARG